MGLKKFFLPLLLVLIFCSQPAFAYQIIDNCVVEENQNYKLTACPAVAYSPTNKDFTQTFTLENKSDQNFLNNVWVAYKFDDPIVTGSVERFRPATFDYVTHTEQCPSDANTLVRLNSFQSNVNPHYGECYYNYKDANGMDVNRFVFKKQFYDYSQPNRTIDYFVWETTQTQRWNNVNSLFDFKRHSNAAVYYTNTAASFSSGHTETWKLNYTPDPSTQNKKWELAIYSDADKECIFTNSCSKLLWLDPWWEQGLDWNYKMKFDLDSYAGSEAITNFGLLLDVNSEQTSFWDNVKNDGSDVRVLNCAEDTLLNYGFEDFNTVTEQAYIWADVNFSSSSDCVYLYWGNSSASAVDDITSAFPTQKYGAAWLFSKYFGVLQDATSNNNDLTVATGTPIIQLTGGLPGSATDDINLNNYYSIGGLAGMNLGNQSRTLIQAIKKDQAYNGIDPNSNFGVGIGTGSAAKTFNLGMQNATTSFIGFSNDITCGDNILDGDWHVQAANFAGNDINKLTVYVEGLACGSAKYNLFTTTSSPSIGRLNYTTEGQKNDIDSVFWIDENITADEVLAWNQNLQGTLGTWNSPVRTPGLFASFTQTPPAPYGFDPELGINSVTIDFNDTTIYVSGISRASSEWDINGVSVSTDQNLSHTFTAIGDYNVALFVTSNDGNVSQASNIVSIQTAAQGVDINYSWKANSATLDVNYGVTTSGIINYVVWGFPNDQNQSGLMVSKSYREGDTRNVCAIVNTTGDVNKIVCETFYNTRLISQVPIDITNLNLLTPYTATLSINPIQSYSGISVDQNFWFFYQSPDFNQYNLTVDANLSFYVSNYLIATNTTDLNQTIQPYMIPVTDGISVVFTTKDTLTNDIVPTVLLKFNRNISGVGNVLVQSGVTDDLGRISLAFIPDLDHNFSVEYPFETILKTGIYRPVTADATDGITVLIPTGTITGDQNAFGGIDINFLQNIVTVKANNTVDLNQVVVSTRAISSITISVDYNGTNLYSDTNSGAVATGGIFGQNVNVLGLNRSVPLIITYSIVFVDGGTVTITKGVSIATGTGLYEAFVNSKNDLGDTGGTMILIAFVLAILLGAFHHLMPSSAESGITFIIAAAIIGFLSFVGWVDGVSWVVATIAAGAAYMIRRIPQ